MVLSAYKMDGLGNDFVILDNRNKSINLNINQIKKISDRKFIGCDQLIIFDNDSENDAKLKFYNSDGSVASACGNGTRCVAYLLSKENGKKIILLKTESGILKSQIFEKNTVETKMGKAKFQWNEIPLIKNYDTKNLKISILNKFQKEFIGGIAINIGNPHLIFFIKNLEDYDLSTIGPKLENHKYFPEKCNVTLAEIINKKLIKVRVWERGAGLTKSCGTAACATAVAGYKFNLCDDSLSIGFSQGKLIVSINKDFIVSMKGPVSNIKKIEIKI